MSRYPIRVPAARPMRPAVLALLTLALALALAPAATNAQEARARWERMCLIRAEKFDLVLPTAMRDNDLDMWIVVMREGLLDPMWEALGRGCGGGWAYSVFTARGDGGAGAPHTSYVRCTPPGTRCYHGRP